MAFDMYYGNVKACINTYEEDIFALPRDNPRYPNLNWILSELYNSPNISPGQSNLLVHELIALRNEVSSGEFGHCVITIDRLLPFFSQAYLKGSTINTCSD